MDQNHPEDPCRRLALRQLEYFADRILQGTVRRIASWRRIPNSELTDLVMEATQELAVDCLERASLLVALPPTVRHAHWMRQTERWIYRMRFRNKRRAATCDLTNLPARPASDQHALDVLEAHGIVRLRNGRSNLRGSRRHSGLSVRRVRACLKELAGEAGAQPDLASFWQARAGEALLGLAADLLLDSGLLQVVPRSRQRPDPEGRRRRLARMKRQIPVLPETREARNALRGTGAHHGKREPSPRRLLERATALLPHRAAAFAWLAEACLLENDLPAAAAAVREARRLPDHCRSSTILLRVRLLESRGRSAAAWQVLQRALHRWPREAGLLAASGRERGADSRTFQPGVHE